LLAIYSQNALDTEIKRFKIMGLLKFSIAIIRPKFKLNHQISTHGSNRVAKNTKGFLKFLLSCKLACSQNLAKFHVDHRHFCFKTKVPKKSLHSRFGTLISNTIVHWWLRHKLYVFRNAEIFNFYFSQKNCKGVAWVYLLLRYIVQVWIKIYYLF
jgi:hypothetical protein